MLSAKNEKRVLLAAAAYGVWNWWAILWPMVKMAGFATLVFFVVAALFPHSCRKVAVKGFKAVESGRFDGLFEKMSWIYGDAQAKARKVTPGFFRSAAAAFGRVSGKLTTLRSEREAQSPATRSAVRPTAKKSAPSKSGAPVKKAAAAATAPAKKAAAAPVGGVVRVAAVRPQPGRSDVAIVIPPRPSTANSGTGMTATTTDVNPVTPGESDEVPDEMVARFDELFGR